MCTCVKYMYICMSVSAVNQGRAVQGIKLFRIMRTNYSVLSETLPENSG